MNKRKELSENTSTQGYTFVKNTFGRWQSKARFVIEQIIGKHLTPNDHIYFKDKNKQNHAPDNLVLINTKTKDKIVFDSSNLNVYYISSIPTWSMLYDSCLSCKTVNKPHASHGLCRNCYMRKYRRKNT